MYKKKKAFKLAADNKTLYVTILNFFLSCSGCYAFAVTFLAKIVRYTIKLFQYRTPAELIYVYYRIGIFCSWTISARTFCEMPIAG
jgi:hypothetical protein